MRLVRTLLPPEVDRRIARVIVIGTVADLGVLAVQGPEALHRRERLDQRAVHAEVVLADQTVQNRLGHHAVEEVPNEPVSIEPLAVHTEDLRRPHRLRGGHVKEPAVQKVVADLLAQLNLAAEAVEGLQEQRFDQSFRRDAGPSCLGVGPAKTARHLPQNAIDPSLDRSERMIRGDHLFEVEGMEDFVLIIDSMIIDSTTHRTSSMTRFDALYEPGYFLLG